MTDKIEEIKNLTDAMEYNDIYIRAITTNLDALIKQLEWAAQKFRDDGLVKNALNLLKTSRVKIKSATGCVFSGYIKEIQGDIKELKGTDEDDD
jgi:hypothetical protein